MNLFGRNYDSVGSSNSDFLIKTKGFVKIQWGSKFIDIINDSKGISLGSRHITISTCGIVPKIKEFSNYKQVNLAISLHAPNNKIRNELMPINKAYNIEKLISAIKEYIDKTNRRVTFEYILLKGVNDKEENAIELARLINKMNAYVNLIPYNEVITKPYKKVTKEKAEEVLQQSTEKLTVKRPVTLSERKKILDDFAKKNNLGKIQVLKKIGSPSSYYIAETENGEKLFNEQLCKLEKGEVLTAEKLRKSIDEFEKSDFFIIQHYSALDKTFNPFVI